MLVSLVVGGVLLAGGTAAKPETAQPNAALLTPAAPTSTRSAPEPPALALPTPTPVPATAIPQEPQASASPAGQPTEVAWADVATVDGDYFVRGNPAAPIRLIDFSDFL